MNIGEEDSPTLDIGSTQRDSVWQGVEHNDCTTINESTGVRTSCVGTNMDSETNDECGFGSQSFENVETQVENEYYNYWGNQFQL